MPTGIEDNGAAYRINYGRRKTPEIIRYSLKKTKANERKIESRLVEKGVIGRNHKMRVIQTKRKINHGIFTCE